MIQQDIDKLKRNNLELQEIINNSWDGIGIIDKSTKFIYVNNAFVPILGFSKDELFEKNLLSLMDEKYKKEFLKLLVVENKDKKYKAEIDISCTRKDKKKVYLKITISSMLNKNLFVINTKDITSQVSDDEILDDYVISMHTDLHGQITKVSSAFLKLSGYSEDNLVGKSFSQLAHIDTDKIIYTNMLSNLENYQEFQGKFKKVKKDGTPFWIDLRAKPIFNKYGDVTGYTFLMFDITNEINLNDESSMLQTQIHNAKKEIEEKNTLLAQKSKLEIMSETLQLLSHEWRQPLNFISIQAQKLEFEFTMDSNPDEKEVISSLENIKNEAQKLSETIESFQKFIKLKDTKDSTNGKTILSKSLENFKDDIEFSKIKIVENIEEDFQFETFENELCNVLIYILTNSKEAIIKNKIQNPKIEILQYHMDNKLYFEIKDNAKGLNEEIKHKIFEPYFSTKDQKHGVGLGLYLSKIIVNIHLNGIITAYNNDLGTTVKISIPIE